MTELTRRGGIKAIAAAGAVLMTRSAARAALPSEPPIQLELTAVAPGLIRLTVMPIIAGKAVALADSGSLTPRNWPAPAARLRSGDAGRELRCAGLLVAIKTDPLRVDIATDDGQIVQTLRWSGSALAFRTGDAPLLGLGQGGPGFDRRGAFDAMKSGQGGYKLATHGSRVPIQWLVGTEGWAMFVHQPVGAFDLTGPEGRFLPAATGGALDLFIAASKEPAELMRAYAAITGHPEMPPLWSLGYQQSHRTLGPPEEILAEAKEFRARKLPCDALIYLGTGFCPNGWNTDNGEFAWNPRAFPDPTGAIRALHGDGYKIVLHVVVEGRRVTGRVTDPCTAPPLPSGRLPDGTWPPDRQVACYWPQHKALADLGIDGWWPDQGDGLDAPSRLARNRMYFEGQQLWRPGKRVYALNRNGFAGMQRFASFLWSGDVESRWETLANHVPIAINTALSGVPYWGTDIGGFVATDEFSGELYARWFQFGAFNPLFRSHGRDWRMHRPWGWTDGERGFPETAKWHPDPASLKDARVEPICRQYLNLRYRLTPYLYAAVREACDSGMPIVRALWLHYADDGQAVSRGDQFLYGRDLLVAPVVEKGAVSRLLYLPKGEWWDWWDHSRHAGGREIERTVDLATMPLFVRAGAIVPMGPVKQYLAEPSGAPTTLQIFSGADGRFTLYADDGESFDFRRGAYRRTDLAWSEARRELRISPAHDAGHLPQGPTRFVVRLAGTDAAKTVTFDGKPLVIAL